MTDLRETLFHDWPGCSNHGCIVTEPLEGWATNGQCKCLVDASRAQLMILQGRLSAVLNREDKR